MIKELRQDGSNFIGRAKIMDTPMGNIVKNLMDEGACLGVSTRGMGSIRENKQGVMEVQDDFHLATAADIVADPSAPDAFVRGIMEGVEWVWDNGLLKAQKLEEMKTTIKKTSRKITLNQVSEFNNPQKILVYIDFPQSLFFDRLFFQLNILKYTVNKSVRFNKYTKT